MDPVAAAPRCSAVLGGREAPGGHWAWPGLGLWPYGRAGNLVEIDRNDVRVRRGPAARMRVHCARHAATPTHHPIPSDL